MFFPLMRPLKWGTALSSISRGIRNTSSQTFDHPSLLNPNQGVFLCQSIKWGGSKWHIAPMLSFHPQKLSKLTKTGLRWKLASLCTYMSFEIHPMFHKIFIRSSQSSPIWTEKIFSSFLSKNGEYSQYFDLHIQYLHQMKAQTILHSNLIQKWFFWPKIFWKIWCKLDYLQF